MKLPKLDLAMQKSCRPAVLGRMWQASRRTITLDHSPPHQFACCQWQRSSQPSTAYLIYRWLLFLLVVTVAVASFAFQRLPRNYDGPVIKINYFKWFIYFTNWGFLLIALQAGLALVVVYRYKREKPCVDDEIPMQTSRHKRTPMICRVYWLIQNIAIDLAFVISLVYWTLVHDPKIHDINALNLLVHGGNSLIMLCEIAVTTHPIRMTHALYGAGAGLMYGIFSAFYWAVGGTDRLQQPAIYKHLDWNRPGYAIGFVAVCAVVLVFAHALATCLAVLRVRLARRLQPVYAQTDSLTLPIH